jgi:DNA adenine methylase
MNGAGVGRSGPVLRYPGSKWNMAEQIAASFPAHACYLEPFGGSLAVLLAKGRAEVETANDLDGDVMNFFRVLRDQADHLVRAVALTPWHRDEWRACVAEPRVGERVEDARRFLVRSWQGHGGKANVATGWAHTTVSQGESPASRTWGRDLPGRLLATVERLQGVQFESAPALDLLAKHARPDVLIYADPPYPLSTRSRRLYKHELTDDDQDAHPGPVVLSGYACPLYDDRLQGWQREEIAATAEGGRARTEIVWRNRLASRPRLFA